MMQPISCLESRKVVQFPIMLKAMTDEEIKEYHLKKIYELSLKSLGPSSKAKQFRSRTIRTGKNKNEISKRVGGFGADNDI